MNILEKSSISCNILALILCIPLTVSLPTLIPHLHHRSKVSSTSSYNFPVGITAPSCIPLVLMSIQPIKYVKRFPQATYITRISQMASLLSHMVNKAVPSTKNTLVSASLSVFLSLPSIDHLKPNQHLQPIT